MPTAPSPQKTVCADSINSVDAFSPLRLPPVSDKAPQTGRSRLLATPAIKEKLGPWVPNTGAGGDAKNVLPVRLLKQENGDMQVAYHHKPFAQGGYAKVYRGVDVNTGVPVVVKKYTPRDMETFWRDTDNELRAAALIDSPAVPSHLLTLKTANKAQVYAVVPWMRGDMFEAVHLLHGAPQTRATRFDAYRLAVHLGQQAARPLAKLHEANWVHRDIKPDNFLRTPNHQLKVADFGFAAPADSPEAQTGRLSLCYAAPEVLARTRTSPPIDARAADVYSLGATLMHTCLPRSYPFYAKGEQRLFGEHHTFMNTHAVLLRDGWPQSQEGRQMVRKLKDLAGLRKLLLGMMHPEPEERPSMRQVVQQLKHPDFEPSQKDYADIQNFWKTLDRAAPAPHAQLHHVIQWLEKEAWPAEAPDDATKRMTRLRRRLDALG